MKTSIIFKTVLAVFLISVILGSSVLMPISAADKSAVEDFVTRFYQLCLNRDPDPDGLNYWVSALLNGDLTGSDVAHGFVFSKEFTDKNTTPAEYLQVLYEAFFDRQPDTAGWQNWLDALADGSSRQDVLDGFIFAKEFEGLCDTYGIKAYEGHITQSSGEDVEAFVTRFYQLCLDRNPDPKGLGNWSGNLLNQTKTGADVATGFMSSKEFLDKSTTNPEYLTILYKAFFNRDPDPDGYSSWLAELDAGKDRGFVLDGFLYSKEFSGLCALYGILPFVTNKNIDNDADGYTGDQGDCNDNNYNIHPGAVEICGDGIDQNCDGYDKPCTICTDISGDWYINETVTVSCCLDGNCETDSFKAGGIITIQQSGCDFSYDADVGGYGTFTRTGTVDGNEIRFNGLSMVAKSGCSTILDSLDIGGIVGFPDISLQGSGILTRTCVADRFSCTVAYNAQLTNVYPYPSMLSNDNQDGDWQ